MKPGAANPFIDPEGYKKFVAQKELDFKKELEKQTAAAR
jgi:metallo-beta-lactamase class B